MVISLTATFVVRTESHRKLTRHENASLISAVRFITNAKFGVTGLYDI